LINGAVCVYIARAVGTCYWGEDAGGHVHTKDLRIGSGGRALNDEEPWEDTEERAL
jgi:hypothetical protein